MAARPPKKRGLKNNDKEKGSPRGSKDKKAFRGFSPIPGTPTQDASSSAHSHADQSPSTVDNKHRSDNPAAAFTSIETDEPSSISISRQAHAASTHESNPGSINANSAPTSAASTTTSPRSPSPMRRKPNFTSMGAATTPAAAAASSTPATPEEFQPPSTNAQPSAAASFTPQSVSTSPNKTTSAAPASSAPSTPSPSSSRSWWTNEDEVAYQKYRQELDGYLSTIAKYNEFFRSTDQNARVKMDDGAYIDKDSKFDILLTRLEDWKQANEYYSTAYNVRDRYNAPNRLQQLSDGISNIRNYVDKRREQTMAAIARSPAAGGASAAAAATPTSSSSQYRTQNKSRRQDRRRHVGHVGYIRKKDASAMTRSTRKGAKTPTSSAAGGSHRSIRRDEERDVRARFDSMKNAYSHDPTPLTVQYAPPLVSGYPAHTTAEIGSQARIPRLEIRSIEEQFVPGPDSKVRYDIKTQNNPDKQSMTIREISGHRTGSPQYEDPVVKITNDRSEGFSVKIAKSPKAKVTDEQIKLMFKAGCRSVRGNSDLDPLVPNNIKTNTMEGLRHLLIGLQVVQRENARSRKMGLPETHIELSERQEQAILKGVEEERANNKFGIYQDIFTLYNEVRPALPGPEPDDNDRRRGSSYRGSSF